MEVGLPFPISPGLAVSGGSTTGEKAGAKAPENGENFAATLQQLIEENKSSEEEAPGDKAGNLMLTLLNLVPQNVVPYSVSPNLQPDLVRGEGDLTVANNLLPKDYCSVTAGNLEQALLTPMKKGQGMGESFLALLQDQEHALAGQPEMAGTQVKSEGIQAQLFNPKGAMEGLEINGQKADSWQGVQVNLRGEQADLPAPTTDLRSPLAREAQLESPENSLAQFKVEQKGSQPVELIKAESNQHQEPAQNSQNLPWGNVGEKTGGNLVHNLSSGQEALPGNFQSIAAQLVHYSKATISQGKSQVEIHLKPEHLGKVHLHLTLEDGVLTAKFLVENQAVGRMLESNLQDLRQSLQEQGLKFGQVQVEVGTGGFAQEHQNQLGQWRGSFVTGSWAEMDPVQEDLQEQGFLKSGVDFLA